jgi:hypothetical protein
MGSSAARCVPMSLRVGRKVFMENIKTLKRGESFFQSGQFGSVCRRIQGLVRIERQGYLQQQRRMHDMMKMRTGCVAERIAYLLKLLSLKKDGSQSSPERRDLPVLNDLACIVDSSAETVCRELNTFMPARVYQRPPLALVA